MNKKTYCLNKDGFCFLPKIFSDRESLLARGALWDVINGKYENYENTLIPIEYDMLKRDKFCNIVNQMLVKNYQVVYTKRKLQKCTIK